MNIWTRGYAKTQLLWLLGLGGVGFLLYAYSLQQTGNGLIITGLLFDIKGAGSVVLGTAESGGSGGKRRWWQLGSNINPRGAWALFFLTLWFGMQIVGTWLNDCAGAAAALGV